MQTIPLRFCALADKTCVGPCPGYGTQSTCPPLIVIAVAASQQIGGQTSALRMVGR